ncbi:MAG: hypothetical protein K2X48_18670 [Chitinophagaceae bacterium]|nr:hypothetical protein [Chitinophagaceae bacterium]
MGLLNHEPGMFFWEIIAFAIFMVILKKTAWKPLVSYLRQRRKTISDSLLHVEKVKWEVNELKNQHEILRKKTYDGISALRKDTKEYTTNLLLEAGQQAQMDYEFIMKEAKFDIQRLEQEAVIDIKNKIGTLVVEVSESVLRKALSEPGEQERYINRLLVKTNLNMATYDNKK